MTHFPARQPAGVPAGGQFATMTQSEATGVTLTPSPADLDVDRFGAVREQMYQSWLEAEDSPDFPQTDRQLQRASAQLAAAAILRDYPDAETLVLWENLDGETQYDVAAVRDANELDIVDASEDGDWTRNEVGGTNSPQLNELGWALDLNDDTWGEGIAEFTSDRFNGKTAVINLKAAVQAPATTLTPRQVTNAALRQYSDIEAHRSVNGTLPRNLKDASQQATVQLLAASIVEKYPTASQLRLRDNPFNPDSYGVISLLGPEGQMLEYGAYGDHNFYEKPIPGSDVSMNNLVHNLDKHDTSWAEGIGETKAETLGGSTRHTARIDLRAVMARQTPARSDIPMADTGEDRLRLAG